MGGGPVRSVMRLPVCFEAGEGTLPSCSLQRTLKMLDVG